MLLKLGMGSGGTRTVERKNETWQQSRELEIKSLDIRELKQRRRQRHKNGKEQQLCTYITLFSTFLGRRRTTTT